MKAFCEYNGYEIAGEYEDAGKSGKSIEGRIQFNRMLEDTQTGIMNVRQEVRREFRSIGKTIYISV